MKLDSNNHSVFLMHYHLVLVVKYRIQVFDNELSDFAKEMFIKIGSKYNLTMSIFRYKFYHIKRNDSHPMPQIALF